MSDITLFIILYANVNLEYYYKWENRYRENRVAKDLNYLTSIEHYTLSYFNNTALIILQIKLPIGDRAKYVCFNIDEGLKPIWIEHNTYSFNKMKISIAFMFAPG